jgi:hypothetical protein
MGTSTVRYEHRSRFVGVDEDDAGEGSGAGGEGSGADGDDSVGVGEGGAAACERMDSRDSEEEDAALAGA